MNTITRRSLWALPFLALVPIGEASASKVCSTQLKVPTATRGVWGQPVRPDMADYHPYQADANPKDKSVKFHFLRRASVTVYPLDPVPDPVKGLDRGLQLHLHKVGKLYLRSCGVEVP